MPGAFLDVHLMVMEPERFVEPFAQAGANMFTFHIERHRGTTAVALAERVRSAGMLAGIAVNPPTAIDPVLEVVEAFDMVLVMSVNPGFSGQAFIPEVLEKARRVKPRLRPTQRLEVDGGVSERTAPACREAGMDVLVAASAIFGKPPAERAAAVRSMRG
jgi:ribulose-phosphate 3-epimerase